MITLSAAMARIIIFLVALLVPFGAGAHEQYKDHVNLGSTEKIFMIFCPIHT